VQAVVPVSGRNPNAHNASEIREALSGLTGSRRWSFRYSLLDRDNRMLIEDLDNVISGKVEQSWQSDIKRTATFSLRDTGVINYLTDRIMPRARLHLAPFGAYDWVEWPLGVFLLNSPKRKAETTGLVVRDVIGYDALQVYADDCPPGRYTVPKLANIVGAVSTLLGAFVSKVITPNTTTLTVAKSWDPGTTRLRIINELLSMINYNSLAFNETGQALVTPYVSPDKRTAEWTYADDDYGLMIPGMEQSLDLASIPNQVTLVVSDPDRAELVAIATNANPASVTSTIRRGRVISDIRQEQDVPTLALLQAKAANYLAQASQVYESVEFDTGLNPLHSGNDVYRLKYGPLALNNPYVEQSWSMELKAGARMRHTARRVITV
jgi:hypothetical protein